MDKKLRDEVVFKLLTFFKKLDALRERNPDIEFDCVNTTTLEECVDLLYGFPLEDSKDYCGDWLIDLIMDNSQSIPEIMDTLNAASDRWKEPSPQRRKSMGIKSRSNWSIPVCLKTKRGVPCNRRNCQICIGGNEYEPEKKRRKKDDEMLS